MKTKGKRRTARSMAVQMLYQSDLGGSPLSQIFQAFDLRSYLTGKGKGDDAEDAGETEDLEGGASKKSGSPRLTQAQRAQADRRLQQLREGFEYAKTLVRGTREHQDKIDDLIQKQADNWRLERMPAVDRNILRLAIYEMLYETDVPKLVVVDEAIELAKQFGSDQSSRFVNGLLDGLLKSRDFPGHMT